MTGPQHYKEAERLLDSARHSRPGGIGPSYGIDKQFVLSAALVHSMLANAAATALGTSPTEAGEWEEAAGTGATPDSRQPR